MRREKDPARGHPTLHAAPQAFTSDRSALRVNNFQQRRGSLGPLPKPGSQPGHGARVGAAGPSGTATQLQAQSQLCWAGALRPERRNHALPSRAGV